MTPLPRRGSILFFRDDTRPSRYVATGILKCVRSLSNTSLQCPVLFWREQSWRTYRMSFDVKCEFRNILVDWVIRNKKVLYHFAHNGASIGATNQRSLYTRSSSLINNPNICVIVCKMVQDFFIRNDLIYKYITGPALSVRYPV